MHKVGDKNLRDGTFRRKGQRMKSRGGIGLGAVFLGIVGCSGGSSNSDATSMGAQTTGHIAATLSAGGTAKADFLGQAKLMGQMGLTCQYEKPAGLFTAAFRIDAQAEDYSNVTLHWWDFDLKQGESRAESFQPKNSVSIQATLFGPPEFRLDNDGNSASQVGSCETTLGTYNDTQATISLDCSGLHTTTGDFTWSLSANFTCGYKSVP
jgi:hypothetical protein